MAELDDMDVVCAICTNPLGEDATAAEDKQTYCRPCIEGWFRTCRDRSQPITSPWTREEMGERLVSSKQFAASPPPATDLRHLGDLRRIFTVLDGGLTDLLRSTLEGWEPPMIVMIGQESSGKSSILERLCMMPIFPRGDEICTRLPIHVRLRHAPRERASPPRLCVVDDNAECVKGPFVLPCATGHIEVREEMEKILSEEQVGAREISRKHTIVLQIESPFVPSLDLVDLPGLVAAPSEARENTKALIEAHIAEHDHHSLYLLVVPASVAPNVSLAADLVLEKNLERRTVGVFTMCDELPRRKIDTFKKRLDPKAGEETGAVTLAPHGWIATMLAPIESEDGPPESPLSVLRRQAAAEENWFKENMPDQLAEGTAASGSLITRTIGLFHGYLQRDWGPRTLQLIDRQLESVRIAHASLGLPALRGQPADARCQAITESLKVLELNRGAIMHECCHVVLHSLKQDVLSAVEPELHSIVPEAFVDLWANQRQEVEEACKMAAQRWVKFNADAAREALERRPAVPFDREQALEGAVVGLFVLTRFPKWIHAVNQEYTALLQKTAEKALAVALQTTDNFFSGSSPYVSLTTDLSVSPARMTVMAHANRLAEGCVFAFLSTRSVAQAELEQRLEDVAQRIDESFWDEVCAEEREDIVTRERKLKEARETIRSLLSIEACRESTCSVCGEPFSSAAGHFCSRRTQAFSSEDDFSHEGGHYLKTMF